MTAHGSMPRSAWMFPALAMLLFAVATGLALGSSLATIGLTVPAVAVVAYTLDKQLVLGLNAPEMVLLVLTFVISMLTFGTGRTNILFGFVHMLVFAVFLFMIFVP